MSQPETEFNRIFNSELTYQFQSHSSPVLCDPHLQNRTQNHYPDISLFYPFSKLTYHCAFWISLRPISNSQLHTLLYFHLCPIYLILSEGS